MNFSITVTESYLTAPGFSARDNQHACASTVAVVNYPNEHLYTRVTEFKYLTGQHTKTSIVYEYPREGDPYYPVPRPENAELKKYKALADAGAYISWGGWRHTSINMDQVVAQVSRYTIN